MLTPREGEIYQAGFAAYDPKAGEGFRQNPFLYGPGREAEALVWWQGYQARRELARLGDPRAGS